MEGLKRSNPFMDDEFMKEVNKKVLTNPSEYALKPKEDEHTAEMLNCTMIHIGRADVTFSIFSRGNRSSENQLQG
jgi:hypothetical protein